MTTLAKILGLLLAICFLISVGRQTLWGPFEIGAVLFACWIIVVIAKEIFRRERQ
jgi:hypothetical protein